MVSGRSIVAAGGMFVSVIVCFSLAACASRPSRMERLHSENPLERVQAAVESARAEDPRAVPALVDMLDDPDVAVRFYAIMALRRMCGENFGYHYYADAWERAQAAERWREALRAGRLTVGSKPTASAPSAGDGEDGGVVDGATRVADPERR
jgi:hypothetical protein